MKKKDFLTFAACLCFAGLGFWINGYIGGIITGFSILLICIATLGKWLASKTISRIDKKLLIIIQKTKTMEMKFDIAAAKPLAIINRNNKFKCKAFIEINFAPKHGTLITEKDYDKIYVIKEGEESIFVQLVDFVTIPFIKMSTLLTIAATGQEAYEWGVDWLKKYPKTENETMMAVYCYKNLD